jgi:hypothetical protein
MMMPGPGQMARTQLLPKRGTGTSYESAENEGEFIEESYRVVSSVQATRGNTVLRSVSWERDITQVGQDIKRVVHVSSSLAPQY